MPCRIQVQVQIFLLKIKLNIFMKYGTEINIDKSKKKSIILQTLEVC